MPEFESSLSNSFKMSELGPLPEDWQVVRLGEVVALERGVSWSKSDEATSGIGALGIPNIREDGHVDLTPRVRIKKKIPPEKWLTQGDVLLVGSSGSIQNVGRVGVVSDDSSEPLTYASFTVRARVSDSRMDQIFLSFLLRSPWVKFSTFSKRAADGKYNLQVQQLRDHLVPLPPLPEQRAIAHVLRTVQRAKEATERVIQATRELKKSLMRHLFTYGPVPVNEVEKVPLKETEIGLVPEHWEVQNLKNVATFIRDSINPSSYPNEIFDYYSIPAYQETGGPVLEAGKKIRSQKLVVEANDILFGKLNPRIPKVLIVTASRRRKIASTEFIPLRGTWGTIVAEYLYYLCWSDHIMPKAQELVSGSTPSRQRVDVKAFLSLPIPLPPLSEQREIAYILRAVDQKLQAEETRKQALEALFRSLLHDLMTGKIRVRDLVPPEVREKAGVSEP